MEYLSLYKAYSFYSSDDFNKLYINRFNSEASVKLFLEIQGNQSFLFFSKELIFLINKIHTKDKEVKKIFENLPYVAKIQYQKKSMIDEIEFSNSIEGVVSTRKDINEIIEDIKLKNGKQERLRGIINKYSLLINNKDIILDSINDIRTLYDDMLYEEISSSDPNNLPDGKIFRKDVVNVTSVTGKVIHKGVVPEEKIIFLLDEALKLLKDDKYDALIKVALFHYIFSFIHPFYDGNGRINRFISSYVLSKNYLPIMGCRLSLTIKENLTDYYDAFKHTNDIRNKGDLTLFVIEFLKIIYKAYEKTEIYAASKLKMLKEYQSKISNNNLDPKTNKILYILVQVEMFSEFGLSIQDMSHISDISKNIIRDKISLLMKAGLVKEINISKRKYYSAILENI